VHRVHLSIRDMLRCDQMFDFFCRNIGQPLLGFDPLPTGGEGLLRARHQRKLEAVLLALALCYYLRLPQEPSMPYRERFLAEWGRFVRTMADRSLCAFDFKEVLTLHLQRFIACFDLPVGIAKTRILQENLFAMLCAEETVTPLIVKGPPGCSKTLSVSILTDALKKPDRAPGDPFAFCHVVHRFTYEGDEHSTSAQIESVYRVCTCRQPAARQIFADVGSPAHWADSIFEGVDFWFCCGVMQDAIDRQLSQQSTQTARHHSLVVIDEGGLPSEKTHALKILHGYMDHPVVCTIILSNSMLDAAKVSRLTVTQTSIAGMLLF